MRPRKIFRTSKCFHVCFSLLNFVGLQKDASFLHPYYTECGKISFQWDLPVEGGAGDEEGDGFHLLRVELVMRKAMVFTC
jgi:hypothetical protein